MIHFFKSHLGYCISSWGGIHRDKLNLLFTLQKRCVRLLFGSEYTYDHAGYYETCARVRTYQKHISKKSYSLEHTKPIFNNHNILTIHNLSVYHTFIETFKILKYHVPVSMYSLYYLTPRCTRFLLHLPKVHLDKSKNNFLYRSCIIWNTLSEMVFEKDYPNKKGIVVQDSSKNSDFTATVPFIKNKLRNQIMIYQKLGEKLEWANDNFA